MQKGFIEPGEKPKRFYKDVSVVGEWEHFWGKKSEKISTTGKNGTQAGGFNG